MVDFWLSGINFSLIPSIKWRFGAGRDLFLGSSLVCGFSPPDMGPWEPATGRYNPLEEFNSRSIAGSHYLQML